MEITQRHCGVFIIVGLIAAVLAGPAYSAAGAERGDGYLCVPNSSGDGWDCDPDSDEVPPITWNKVAPVVRTTPPTERAAATVPETTAPAATTPAGPARSASAPTADPNIDPVTGLSTRPQDWYTPTTPRPVDADHALTSNLAQAVYVQTDASTLCPGGYQERLFPLPRDADNESYPIVVLADSMSSTMGTSADIQGNVTVEQGNRVIRTSSAQLDYPTRVVQFPQGLKVDQPGLIMQGSAATMHLNTKQADLSDAQFVLTDASLRGQTTNLAQSSDGDLTLQQNHFTRCEPGNNGWRLETQELVIEKDAIFGTARHAVLRLKSVPVFYTPRLQFPVSDERLSGFLFPNMGYSDEDGVDVSIPYYFNLAPDYDATLIPRYISDRGAGAELEFRHLSSWQTTTLGGGYLPSDDLYNGVLDRDNFEEAGGAAVLGPFEPADRWLGAIDHQGRIGAFRTLVDYTSVSDRDYFSDLGSDLGVSSRRALERKGELQYNAGGLFMRLWAQRFQRLDESIIEDYQRLPEFEAIYATPLVGPLEFSLDAKWSDFDRDTDGLRGINAFTGQRTHLEPRLRLAAATTVWIFEFVGWVSIYAL